MKVRAGISPPMERITLTAGPGRASPYYSLTCLLLGHLKGGTVVQQGIEVMHSPSVNTVFIYRLFFCAFTEINFNHRHSVIQQLSEFSLIPFNRLRVTKIYNPVRLRR